MGLSLLVLSIEFVGNYLDWRQYTSWQVLIRRPVTACESAYYEFCFGGRTLRAARQMEREPHEESDSEEGNFEHATSKHWALLRLKPLRGEPDLDLSITTLPTTDKQAAAREGDALEEILRDYLAPRVDRGQREP